MGAITLKPEVSDNGQRVLKSQELSDTMAWVQEMRAKSDQDQKQAEQDTPTASMGNTRILGGLEDVRIFGIPVGTALGSGAIALIASEVTDSFVDDQDQVMGAFIKLAASGFMTQILGNFLGRQMADTAAIFLTFDAMRDLLPIDDLIRDLLSGLTGNGEDGTTAQSRQGKKGTTTNRTAKSKQSGSSLENRLQRLERGTHSPRRYEMSGESGMHRNRQTAGMKENSMDAIRSAMAAIR